MNRLERKARWARNRNVFVLNAYTLDYEVIPGRWDVFPERESLLGPRGLSLTRREAVHLAYAIAKSAVPKIVVTLVP